MSLGEHFLPSSNLSHTALSSDILIQIDSEYKHSTCFIPLTTMNNFSC